jgi:predicted RNA-binding protein with PUA-like domain
MVDVKALHKTRLIGIAELRAAEPLADMIILRRGNRLSITPVAAAEWRHITTQLAKPGTRTAGKSSAGKAA